MWHMFFLGNTFIYLCGGIIHQRPKSAGNRGSQGWWNIIKFIHIHNMSIFCWYLPSILEVAIPQQDPIENNMRWCNKKRQKVVAQGWLSNFHSTATLSTILRHSLHFAWEHIIQVASANLCPTYKQLSFVEGRHPLIYMYIMNLLHLRPPKGSKRMWLKIRNPTK